jgi:hypothetical protein
VPHGSSAAFSVRRHPYMTLRFDAIVTNVATITVKPCL